MTTASQPQLVTLRSGDMVRIRPVRPDDGPALLRAYANLGDQSRYRRFFTVMPQLPEATLKAAVEVDHADHEALVAVPLLSAEIVGECRFIRLPDQPGTADIGVTVVDAWQGRGLGSVLLARLSERAAAAGIEYFTAEVLAENRAMLGLLPSLGQVQTESHGPVVTARVKLPEPPRQPAAAAAVPGRDAGHARPTAGSAYWPSGRSRRQPAGGPRRPCPRLRGRA